MPISLVSSPSSSSSSSPPLLLTSSCPSCTSLRMWLWTVFVIMTSSIHGVTSTMSERLYFQIGCHDDINLVRSLSSDCSQYLVCYSGFSLGLTCPQGYIFNDYSLRCQLPTQAEKLRCSNTLLNNMPVTCMWNPTARRASYLSCAQYFDCSGSPKEYITECPYPQLYSTVTGKCEPFYQVSCIGRTVPKAPCDYLQYRQLCDGPSCIPCEERHPSCMGKLDGKYLVPRSTRVFFECQAERTINVGRCSPGFVFNASSQVCTLPPTANQTANIVALVSQKPKHELEALLNQLMNLGKGLGNPYSAITGPAARPVPRPATGDAGQVSRPPPLVLSNTDALLAALLLSSQRERPDHASSSSQVINGNGKIGSS